MYFVFNHFAIELEYFGHLELYNLKDDLGQQNNLAASNKEKLEELIAKFEGIRGDHNTTQKIQLK